MSGSRGRVSVRRFAGAARTPGSISRVGSGTANLSAFRRPEGLVGFLLRPWRRSHPAILSAARP